MRAFGQWLVLVLLIALSACRENGPGADASGGKATPSPADGGTSPSGARPADSGPAVSPPPPTFASQVPDLRKQVREASLQSWVKVDDDIPFYRIEAAFDPDFLTYHGRMDLWVKNRSMKPWDKLVFHLYPNFPAISGDLKSLKVTSAASPATPRPGSGQAIDHRTSTIPPTRFELPLAEPLAPGAETTVTLEFSGLVKRFPAPAEGPVGELWSSVSDLLSGGSGDWGLFSYSSGILSLSLWYPVLAVYDEQEGWDIAEPSGIGDFAYFDVADHLVTVHLGDGFELVTSGTLIPNDPNAPSESDSAPTSRAGSGGAPAALTSPDRLPATWTFAAGASREFTVTASKAFETSTATAGSKGTVRIRSVALAGEATTRQLVLDAAVDSFNAYEALFGPYPYTELDVVRTDLRGGVGGVEFPGLVTIAGMLYMDELSESFADMRRTFESRFMKEAVAFVVSHEVAHQWWNAVVGSHCRNHPFVDEALANYSSVLFFERRYGAEAAQRQILFELELPYQLHRFFGGADMPVDQPSDAFLDLVGYSAIVYGKGGMFLKAVRDAIGLEAFSAGLSSYYEKNLFRIATPEILVTTLESSSPRGAQVRELSLRWLAGSHGDEDVGRLDVGEFLPVLLKELDVELDGWVLQTLSEPGFWELIKMADNLVTGKGDPFEGVDSDKILSWAEGVAKKLIFDMLL